MYKITLFDANLPGFISGTCEAYCDDINEFEKEWMKIVTNEDLISRFRKSKAGEIVTDYYSDNPDLNIVQFDKASETIYETNIMIEDFKFKVFNTYGCPMILYGRKADFMIRYVKFQGEYIKLAKFKLWGVCRNDYLINGKYIAADCWGNPFLKTEGKEFKNRSHDLEDFKDKTIESFVYYKLETFKTIEEMSKSYMSGREKTLSRDDLQILLADIPGEAG